MVRTLALHLTLFQSEREQGVHNYSEEEEDEETDVVTMLVLLGRVMVL